ncbi:MAG: ATP-binding protein [Polyangiaceae bacterium]
MSAETSGTSRSIRAEDLLLDARLQLEDLVGKDGLRELCESFVPLFGIPVRIYSISGALLADAGGEHDLCAYVNTLSEGRKACSSTVAAAKARDPGSSGDVTHSCFTGAAYRILAIEYDGRRVGRLIVGPFLPADVADVPATLLGADRAIDPNRVRPLLSKMPRAKAEMVTRLAGHLKASLDLILFSGHKALVTSQLHLASVRDSYRELEEKAARLQEAFDRLKELDRLKSNFLATVSHELRTPLTSIIGYSEMLVEGLAGEMKPEQTEFVRTIHNKGGQLLSLIMGMLDSSKLESGTMRLVKGPVDITAVLAEVISTLAPLAKRKAVKLELSTEGTLAELRGDPERLRQVFINLVENAIKFTPAEGRVVLHASMCATAGDGDDAGFALLAPARALLQVRVVDTGIGIPEAERTKVFDAFYQVDSSSTREYGGTGLGLSIVKKLVEAHGGTIRIEDNPPRGAAFVVCLPQASPPSAGET